MTSIKETRHYMRNFNAGGVQTTPVLFPGRIKGVIIPPLPADGGRGGKKGEGRSSCPGDTSSVFIGFARTTFLDVFWSTPFVVLVAAQLLSQLDKSVSCHAGRTR